MCHDRGLSVILETTPNNYCCGYTYLSGTVPQNYHWIRISVGMIVGRLSIFMIDMHSLLIPFSFSER